MLLLLSLTMNKGDSELFVILRKTETIAFHGYKQGSGVDSLKQMDKLLPGTFNGYFSKSCKHQLF